MKEFFSSILLIIFLVFFTSFIVGQNETNNELVIEAGHSLIVYEVAFSPNGKLLASASGDSTIKLWDIETKRMLKTFSGHVGQVFSVKFSPDGKTIASGGQDKTIIIWSVESGEILKIIPANSDAVVAFSPDGMFLAGGGSDKTIRIWNTESGELLKVLSGHTDFINSVEFSPDGKFLASGGGDNTVKLWSSESGKTIRNLSGHTDSIASVSFSLDGKFLASGGQDNTVRIWNVENGKQIKSLKGPQNDELAAEAITSIDFSPDGKTLAAATRNFVIQLWKTNGWQKSKVLKGHIKDVYSVRFSPDGDTIASGSFDTVIKLWSQKTGTEIESFDPPGVTEEVAISPTGRQIAKFGKYSGDVALWNADGEQPVKLLRSEGWVESITFSPDGKILAVGTTKLLNLWDVQTGKLIKTINDISISADNLIFSKNGKIIVGRDYKSVKIWDVGTGQLLNTLSESSEGLVSITLSPDEKMLAGGGFDKKILIWNVETGQLHINLTGHSDFIMSLAFSPDGKFIAGGSEDKTVKIWSVENGKLIKTLSGHIDGVDTVAFSPDGKTLISKSEANDDNTIRIWDVENGQNLRTIPLNNLIKKAEIASLFPDFYQKSENAPITPDGKFQTEIIEGNQIKLSDLIKKEEICTIIYLEENEWITIDDKQIDIAEDIWVVTTSNGRFDTNKSLDNTKGLHWNVNNEILNPLPLDIFMRQYYEPGLLQRVLKCNEENDCDKEFKPLPSIAEINRVQPKVLIKDVKASANSKDMVDVTVEVESVTEDVSVSSEDRMKNKRETSGVFDLRLFRDGQLVSVSTPPEKLEPFIKDAPNLLKRNEEYFRQTGKLTDTPEDEAWRAANGLIAAQDKEQKKTYTFKNIKLPKDGKENVKFTAYAFNEGKVKSQTTEPFKFEIPETVFAEKKKGKAVLISIGVNSSENPAYKLNYAANDARKMQEIAGGRLLADKNENYSEIVTVPLVSDEKTERFEAVNAARKEIIKGVFSLMAGESYEEVLGKLKTLKPELAAEFQKIPNIEKLKTIEPEDTLIITYSGHGYADRSGIFYLLPYDIGKDMTELTTEFLGRLISSDELSLWMQEITAKEMIFIIDACHSSAAVQGDGFKPGPMGSRGLGQLAYDKDMKILSATQANNVALELGSLEQGILSYALLEDGINKRLANTDEDLNLTAQEWLGYAERRVPELYTEIKDGKRSVFYDGKLRPDGTKSVPVKTSKNQKSALNLQQPTLFDFKRRNRADSLFPLP